MPNFWILVRKNVNELQNRIYKLLMQRLSIFHITWIHNQFKQLKYVKCNLSSGLYNTGDTCQIFEYPLHANLEIN